MLDEQSVATADVPPHGDVMFCQVEQPLMKVVADKTLCIPLCSLLKIAMIE